MLRSLTQDEIAFVNGGAITVFYGCSNGYQIRFTHNSVTGETTHEFTGERCLDDGLISP